MHRDFLSRAAQLVRILDSGVGISPDVLPPVFDLYLQIDSSSRNLGLGLGLLLVRTLVDRHGGSVSATRAGLGQGSEFIVRLPVLPPAAFVDHSTYATGSENGMDGEIISN
ncbi:MAG: ATP-binding protein [Steroidobacteraceae bacterium]